MPCIKFLGMLLMGGPRYIKFDRGNMVVTCHFDICKWEMRGGLVTGHGQ